MQNNHRKDLDMLKRYCISLIFVFFNLHAIQNTQFTKDNTDSTNPISLTQSIDVLLSEKTISQLKQQLLELSNREQILQQQLHETNPEIPLPLNMKAILCAVSAIEYNPDSEKKMTANELKAYFTYSMLIEQEKCIYTTYSQLMKTLFPQNHTSYASETLVADLFSWINDTLKDKSLFSTILDMRK